MMGIALKFFALIAGANQLLSTQRQIISASNANTIRTKALPEDHVYESIMRTRTVRHVGPISIASKTAPTVPSERSAANYTMPTWKQRGHLRTYKKTGKQIWIKEMNKKRHVLENGTKMPTPNVTISAHPKIDDIS